MEIPGYQGAVTRQVFSVFGEKVDDVLKFQIGDEVEVTWTMYAREYNDRLYNQVDLVRIQDANQVQQAASSPRQTKRSPIYDKIEAAQKAPEKPEDYLF